MKKKRSTPSQKIRALLQKEVHSKCPFCPNEDVDHFEVHHIDENPINNAIDNLLLLCPLCHSKITKGDIVFDKVITIKKELSLKSYISEEGSSMNINFNKSVENAIVGNGNVVHIRNAKKTTGDKYSIGSIGKEIHHKNYVSYLITRYHEYKEREVGKERMNYAQFSSHLKKRYKIGKNNTIYNAPLEVFDDLVSYIQMRIDGTMFGKRLGKNHPNFKPFDQYVSDIEKHYPSREQE